MRRRLLLAVLVLMVSVAMAGCKSMARPTPDRSEPASTGPRVPNGEASPFDW